MSEWVSESSICKITIYTYTIYIYIHINIYMYILLLWKRMFCL